MRGIRCFGVLAVMLGCSVEPDGGTGGFGDASAGTTATTPTSTSGDESSGSNVETTGDDDSGGSDDSATTTGVSTSGPATTASESTGSSESGGGSSTGGLASGAYGPCGGQDDCPEAGQSCLKADPAGDQGFCSPGCGSPGATPPNSALCPDPPAGTTAIKVCLEGIFVRPCVLDCTGGLTCPAGTECITTSDGDGPFCFASL